MARPARLCTVTTPSVTPELDLPHDALERLIDPAQDALFAVSPRSGVASAWYGYVPFAFWLVQAAKPRTLVELGTQHGVSYAAFCEAVRLAGLPTQCAAVDSWEGDPAGFAEVAAFQDPRYGSFSRLLRTRFDAAVAQFADGSLDLLHIDGSHAYDAARHDFETWRPKLSTRAVVLLHGINERMPGSGVLRLWAELSRHHPSFAFMHDQGLGVLAVGAELDGPARDLCQLTDPAVVARIRDRFAQSGLRCRAASAEAEARAAEASIATLATEARSARQAADRVDIIARAGETRAAAIRQTLEATEHTLADTQSRLADTKSELAAVGEQLRLKLHELNVRDLTIAQLRHVEDAFNTITQSTMWRAMTPVQKMLARVPQPVVDAVRRSVGSGARSTEPTPVELVVAPPPAMLESEPAPSLVEAPKRPSLADIALPRTGYLPLIEWFDPIAPEVSIVVYNRNAGAAAILCLQRLWQNTTGHRYEIIIVDNGSAADEVARLQAEAPLVQVVPLGGNRHFGEASNIGVEAAQGRLICLLDSASFVTPGWLEPLVQALHADETGAVAPRLSEPDGTLLDAGRLIDPDGRVTILTSTAAQPTHAIVDALSPACLLLRRDDFRRVLGFDLAWDPGSYETADLFLKLRLLGRRAVCSPASVVLRIELDTEHDDVSDDVVALNRAKFVDRWGRALDTMWLQTPTLLRDEAAAARTPGMRPRVLIFTPYQLTPGGGERYILTIAQALALIADVTLVTAYRVSRTRLQTMAREFELDLTHVDLVEAAALRDRHSADLAFVLGNEILPTAAAFARHNIYICQFPFPFKTDADRAARLPFWRDFELILTYSDYVRGHVLQQVAAAGLPARPIEVLTPPVPMVTQRAAKRRGQILHVGRFFIGGHCKRQDAMIEAFRTLIEAGVTAELHFAGSTMPETVHQAYYAGLVERAQGLPITFHPNCSAETLRNLYAESDLYWHATGVGRDVERLPHVVEHFGISIVEAMSARCIPSSSPPVGRPGSCMTASTDSTSTTSTNSSRSPDGCSRPHPIPTSKHCASQPKPPRNPTLKASSPSASAISRPGLDA